MSAAGLGMLVELAYSLCMLLAVKHTALGMLQLHLPFMPLRKHSTHADWPSIMHQVLDLSGNEFDDDTVNALADALEGGRAALSELVLLGSFDRPTAW